MRFIFLCEVRDIIALCVRDIFLGNGSAIFLMRRKIIFLRGDGVKLFYRWTRFIMSWLSVIFRMRWRTRFLRRGWIFIFVGRVCKFLRMRQ